jgi:integrase
MERLEKNAGRARAGLDIIDPDGKDKDLAKALGEWLDALRSRELSGVYIANMRRMIEKVASDLGWTTLPKVRPGPFAKWLLAYRQGGRSGRSSNQYLESWRAFLGWCVEDKRLAEDPLASVKPLEKYETVRKRRALSVEELERLLAAAPSDRRLQYLTAAYTGLRRSELRALRWSDLYGVWNEDADPRIELRASTTKNWEGGVIPLHPRLVAALRVSYKRIIPAGMKESYPDMRVHRKKRNFLSSDPVFPRIPVMETLRKDLEKAGIAYKDEKGRQADFHALRTTFGTWLSAVGVAPRVSMDLMRHNSLEMTMKLYTDPDQLPRREAIMMLPGDRREEPPASSEES